MLFDGSFYAAFGVKAGVESRTLTGTVSAACEGAFFVATFFWSWDTGERAFAFYTRFLKAERGALGRRKTAGGAFW